MTKYYVYIVRCTKDGTLYTGYTTDVKKRIVRHNTGKGAKYTRGRGPVVLVCVQQFPSLYGALSAECAIKKWSRAEKLKVCAYGGMVERCAGMLCDPPVYDGEVLQSVEN